MDIPMMISGTTNEKSMRKLAPAGAGPRQRDMPIAKVTPMGTARNMVRNDRRRLWMSAACSCGLTNSAPDGSDLGCPHHHWVENPCQTAFDRPALNEIPMAMSTGSSDHARYIQVTEARTYGRRQGFRQDRRGALMALRVAGWSGSSFRRSTSVCWLTVSLIRFVAPLPYRGCSTASEASGRRPG